MQLFKYSLEDYLLKDTPFKLKDSDIEQMKQLCVLERSLGRVASELCARDHGSWESVCDELKLPSSSVGYIKEQRSDLQGKEMLKRWREHFGKQATYHRLCKCFDDAQSRRRDIVDVIVEQFLKDVRYLNEMKGKLCRIREQLEEEYPKLVNFANFSRIVIHLKGLIDVLPTKVCSVCEMDRGTLHDTVRQTISTIAADSNHAANNDGGVMNGGDDLTLKQILDSMRTCGFSLRLFVFAILLVAVLLFIVKSASYLWNHMAYLALVIAAALLLLILLQCYHRMNKRRVLGATEDYLSQSSVESVALEINEATADIEASKPIINKVNAYLREAENVLKE